MRPGAPSGPWPRRAALVAATAGLVSCGSAPPLLPAGAEYRPAPRSALVSRTDLQFVWAQGPAADGHTTVLARQQANAAPRPVARLVQVRHGDELHISVQRWPEPWATPGRASLDRAALEQLYSLVLRQAPQARYCLVNGSVTSLVRRPLNEWDRGGAQAPVGAAAPCDGGQTGLSHAQALQALADLREQAAALAPGAVPWRVVGIEPALVRPWDADTVGVRATSLQGPLPGIAIHFDRAPHSICTARTRADGVATCRLEDQHADGHQHDHAATVVATFPGEVRADRVLLPTTHVLVGLGSAAPPAFARPLVFPTSRP